MDFDWNFKKNNQEKTLYNIFICAYVFKVNKQCEESMFKCSMFKSVMLGGVFLIKNWLK